jgi:hypothetical protein
MPTEESKPFYTSKTMWANAIAVIVAVLASVTGYDVEPEAQVGLLALVNMILRVVTSKGLTT